MGVWEDLTMGDSHCGGAQGGFLVLVLWEHPMDRGWGHKQLDRTEHLSTQRPLGLTATYGGQFYVQVARL